MSLGVIVVKRKVLAGEEAGREKWYGQVRTGGRISFEKLCNQVSHHCSATPADIGSVLKVIMRMAADELESGNRVRLGPLGNFRLTAGSHGVEEKSAFTLREMKSPRVTFSPGRDLRLMLRDVKYRKDEGKVTVVTVPCDKNHAV